MNNTNPHQNAAQQADAPTYRFAFFGTDTFSLGVLRPLIEAGYTPTLCITPPSRPVGRKQIITPPPLAAFAEEHDIALMQPEKLTVDVGAAITAAGPFDFFVVASYGKIIPERILSIAKHGALNVHPSLLPRFRGPAPIEGAMLADEKTTGVSIMLLDALMDHGPIIKQVTHTVSEWPARPQLEELFSRMGGDLLVQIIPDWCSGTITAIEQLHDAATYVQKITKSDAEIAFADLHQKPYESFLKIQAYAGWPNAFFMFPTPQRTVRVVIKKARFDAAKNTLHIERVVPEGSVEMDYSDFERGFIDKYKTQ